MKQIAAVTPQAIQIDVDRVTKENPDIHVLRGYQPFTTSDLKPAVYYKNLDLFYKLPQLPPSRVYEGQQIHYGFNPEHLNATGALFKENTLPNNLNNPIHEILNINHWTNTEDSIYKTLEPALRLASMFLQQPVAFQWWCTVMFGERSLDLAAPGLSGLPAQRIKEHIPITNENSSILTEYLKFLGTHVVPEEGHIFTFRFAEQNKLDDLATNALQKPCGDTYGLSLTILDYKSTRAIGRSWLEHWFVAKPKRKYNRVRVLMHGDFYITARKFRDTTNLDINHFLRFNFIFAATLLHEISHCVGFINARHGEDDSLYIPEPFLGNALERESGYNWERSTFGGRITPINGDYSGSMNEWQRSFHAIRMDYMERIQQQNYWKSTAKLVEGEDRSRYLYVPRDGCAVAWSMPHVMPMRFEDLELERLWNLADEQEAEEDRLEELEYAKNDKIQDELDRQEEERKANEQELILAKKAEELLERERSRQAKEKQRLEDEARARYRELFGDNDPWTYEKLLEQQEKSKRPSMRLPARRRVPDRRSQSPEAERESIPNIDNAATREIARLRREEERRKDRGPHDRMWMDRDMERRAVEVWQDRAINQQREGERALWRERENERERD
ncbi:hypothetical protein MMC26_005606 [Xylographa opegraphella]|nr:hypothetical protein [Xylographa opegraphella]